MTEAEKEKIRDAEIARLAAADTDGEEI